MKSETSSTSGDSGDVSTPPSQSPPRGGGGGEKATTFAGNKPRPLRLVADHPENMRKTSAEEDKAAKRQSWMGWFGKKEDAPGAAIGGSEEVIKE